MSTETFKKFAQLIATDNSIKTQLNSSSDQDSFVKQYTKIAKQKGFEIPANEVKALIAVANQQPHQSQALKTTSAGEACFMLGVSKTELDRISG